MTTFGVVRRNQGKRPAVQYQVKAGPEGTRLVMDFKEPQNELLRQIMDLLHELNRRPENGESSL